ncbi:MAG: hypothetical protein K2X91_17230, partial [Thermoleophilia bacterium]|nr:hypothetical protein [Thermoleophilia bacterium]
DSVGAGDAVYLVGSDQALALARSTADHLGIAWGRLRVVGAGMDHQPFAGAGLEAVTILGDVVGRSMDLHSPRDTIEKVEAPPLQRAGALAAAIATAWARRHSDATATVAAELATP